LMPVVGKEKVYLMILFLVGVGNFTSTKNIKLMIIN